MRFTPTTQTQTSERTEGRTKTWWGEETFSSRLKRSLSRNEPQFGAETNRFTIVFPIGTLPYPIIIPSHHIYEKAMRSTEHHFVSAADEEREGAVHLACRELNANDFKRIVLQLSREKERKPPRKCRKLDPESVEYILAHLPRMPRYFNVGGNPIGDGGMGSLNSLPMSIVDLDLSNTKMTTQGAKKLFKYMETNRSIETLAIWGNQEIGDSLNAEVSTMFKRNSTLTGFDCHSCGMSLFTLAEMLHALVGRGTVLKELDYGVLGENDVPCTLKLVKQIFIGFLSSRPAMEKIKIQFGSGDISDEEVGFLTEALRENKTIRHIEGVRDELNTDGEACTVDSLSDNVCFEAKYLLTMNEHQCRTVSPLEEMVDFVEKVAEASNEINVIYHFVRHHAELVVSSHCDNAAMSL